MRTMVEGYGASELPILLITAARTAIIRAMAGADDRA